MKLNCTYHKTIKIISYKVVFNRKPNYKRAVVDHREISEKDVEEEEINDKINNFIIVKSVAQQQMKARVQHQMNRNREKHKRLIQRLKSKFNNKKEFIMKQSRLKEKI